MDDGEIAGKITFSSGSSGYENIIDKPDLSQYDNTKTVIDGGLVTSGTVQLSGSGGDIKAGITGEGTVDTSVRVWAGATKENRDKAPFRVQQDGKVIMTNAEVSGKINAMSGRVGGFDIGNGRIGVASANDTGLGLHNDYIKFSDDMVWVGIGTNVTPPSIGSSALARFEDETVGFGINIKYGVIISVRNGRENHALTLRGDIQGFALSTKIITTNYNVTEDDCVLSCYNSSQITLILPTPTTVGKIYYIRINNSSAVLLDASTSGKEIMKPDGSKVNNINYECERRIGNGYLGRSILAL